jgi:pilus assembly protein Flp/PilA
MLAVPDAGQASDRYKSRRRVGPFRFTQGRPAPRDTREDMKNLALHVKKFLKSEDGPTAVEYAVMLALIVIVCLVSITAIGNNANATFDSIAQALPGAS